MSDRDDGRPRDDMRDETEELAHDVSADEAREIDEGVRALRDEPVASARLARMRAGLDAKIAAAEGSEGVDEAVVPIDAHLRFGRPALGVAAAIAAAVLLALWLGRSGDPTDERAPLRVATDAPPVEIEGDAPQGQIADAGVEGDLETNGDALTQNELDLEGTRDALTQNELDLEGTRDALTQNELEGTRDALPQNELDLEAASDEELALAIEYDQLTDYDVIAQLDLLELLDAMEADGRI